MDVSPRRSPLSSRDAGVAAVRTAVRSFLDTVARDGRLDGGELAVAVSGGPDSLALAALTVPLAERYGATVRGLIVDHGLQPGSDIVAERAARQLADLGARPSVHTVSVTGGGGMEAAARRARYEALAGAAGDGTLVLLGHTRDDQAETVLLGLARGSGPRSIAGMRPLTPPWGRPLLDVPRAHTVRACQALGIIPWSDPHNADPRFLRVRVRTEVLPLLEDVLAGGVSAALARTARQLQADLDVLDELADAAYARAATEPEGGFQGDEGAEGHHQRLRVAPLVETPAAVRTRVLRRWLLDAGARDLGDTHVMAVDALVTAWHGQRGVCLPSSLVVRRSHGRLVVDVGPA